MKHQVESLGNVHTKRCTEQISKSWICARVYCHQNAHTENVFLILTKRRLWFLELAHTRNLREQTNKE